MRQGEVNEIVVEDGKVTGVITESNALYKCKAAVICTGTYLKARCLYGDTIIESGPNGLRRANHLSDSLKKLGVELRRYKTGTPARVDKRTIDFSKMKEQPGDEKIVPFSFENKPEDIAREQISCYRKCFSSHHLASVCPFLPAWQSLQFFCRESQYPKRSVPD